MYRIYLRWPQQRVSDKTVTGDPAVAEIAFCALLRRDDLAGQPVAAVMTLNGKQLEYSKFDVPAGQPNGRKNADDPIRTADKIAG